MGPKSVQLLTPNPSVVSTGSYHSLLWSSWLLFTLAGGGHVLNTLLLLFFSPEHLQQTRPTVNLRFGQGHLPPASSLLPRNDF